MLYAPFESRCPLYCISTGRSSDGAIEYSSCGQLIQDSSTWSSSAHELISLFPLRSPDGAAGSRWKPWRLRADGAVISLSPAAEPS